MDNNQENVSDSQCLDENIIEGIAWAEHMKRVLDEGLNKAFLKWCQMVLNIGENEEVIKQWSNIFVSTHEETLQELVADMRRVQSNVVTKIETLLMEFEQLCYTLQIKMPKLGDASHPLSFRQEQEELKRRIYECKQKIEVRRAELKILYEKQSDLCNSLGKEPKILKDDPLPSPEEMQDLQSHIEKLESEKFDRLEKYFSIKEKLLEIFKELDLQPSSPFEESVLSPDNTTFLVTDNNMKELDVFYNNLIDKQKNIKEEVQDLRNKIDDYWNLLDIDIKFREDFRQQYSGNSLRVLQALRQESNRCKDLKKANIKVFIDKLRTELDQLWEKCHCKEMKSKFDFYYTDCYTEDLLELHEVEIEKWKKYYEENKELLTLLEKHSRLWRKMVELEESARNPNRYNNRGGQLLKEEKERNKLSKQIPHIEEMIYSLNDKFKKIYNESFSTNGISVSDYLASLHEEMENAKRQKLSERKIQREKTPTAAKSAMNLFPTTPSTSHAVRACTPLSTTKRKLATPLIDDSKRPRALSEKKTNQKSKSPIPSIKITFACGRTKRPSNEWKTRIQKIRRLSANKESAKVRSDETFSTDYSQFQSELSNKSDCRSTIIPQEVTPSTPASSRTVTPTRTFVTTPRTPGPSKLQFKTPDTKKPSAAKTNLK